jgi:hypothetical protein
MQKHSTFDYTVLRIRCRVRYSSGPAVVAPAAAGAYQPPLQDSSCPSQLGSLRVSPLRQRRSARTLRGQLVRSPRGSGECGRVVVRPTLPPTSRSTRRTASLLLHSLQLLPAAPHTRWPRAPSCRPWCCRCAPPQPAEAPCSLLGLHVLACWRVGLPRVGLRAGKAGRWDSMVLEGGHEGLWCGFRRLGISPEEAREHIPTAVCGLSSLTHLPPWVQDRTNAEAAREHIAAGKEDLRAKVREQGATGSELSGSFEDAAVGRMLRQRQMRAAQVREPTLLSRFTHLVHQPHLGSGKTNRFDSVTMSGDCFTQELLQAADHSTTTTTTAADPLAPTVCSAVGHPAPKRIPLRQRHVGDLMGETVRETQ